MSERVPANQDDDEEILRKKKIGETSLEYEFHKNTLHTINEGDQPAWSVFGLDVAEDRGRITSSFKIPNESIGETRRRASERLADDLDSSRDLLITLSENPIRKSAVMDLFLETLSDHDISQALKKIVITNEDTAEVTDDEKILIDIFYPNISLETFEAAKHFSSNIRAIPDDIFERILIKHVETFNKNKEIFEKQLPMLKEGFITNIRNAIDRTSIPLSIKTVEDRLAPIVAYLQDTLTTTMRETWGEYLPDLLTIYIAEQLPPSEFTRVYNHEMIHALAGKAMLATEMPDEIGGGIDISNLRSGLLFGTEYSSDVKNHRFHWLNEAVTETVTLNLLSRENSASYVPERELLDLLLKKGGKKLPQQLFIDAYFESYDPEKPVDEHIPAWKKLYAEINEAYRPGFLLQLDKYIKRNDVKSAIKLMKLDWETIQ